MACIVELVREKLAVLAYTLQDTIRAQAKKVARMFLIGSLVFILLGLGLRFLLLGLAYWLNAVLSSAYLGFFLVSIFCFLMVMVMLLMLRRKINDEAVGQDAITDGE